MTPESSARPQEEPDRSPAPAPQPPSAAGQAPQAKPAPRPLGEEPPLSRPGAEPYIPLPGVPAPKKSRWWLAVAAAAALAAAAAGLKLRQAPAPVPAPQAASQAQQVLLVTPADRDAAATAYARQLLDKPGAAAALASQAQAIKAERAAPAAAARQAAPAGPEGMARQVDEALALSAQSVRQAVVDGSAGFYTFHFQDPDGAGGDVIDVSVDGVTLARVVTSGAPSSLTIPLDARTTHTIKETLVYARDRRVYVRAGGQDNDAGAAAQAHVSVASSAGEVRSSMLLGQSQTWTVQMGGAASSLGQ